MKRLFSIGAGLFIFSIVPIASWLVLAIILGDSRISNVFSITYAMQFVWAILKYIFGSGANIRKEKENNSNAVYNSIFWGAIFSIVIFSIPLIFVDSYIHFFGQDVQFYKIYVFYSIFLLLLQTLFALILEKLYFEDRDKTANIHLFAFNLINFCTLILLCLIIKTTWVALLISLTVLVVYIIILYIKEFKKFKISFDFFKNIKYESANIASSFFMMLIYLFGFKNVFVAGEEYVLAISLSTLCTDAQWDTLGAISTIAKVDISKNRFDYKKQMRQSYFFSLIVMLSSLIMFFSLFSVYGVNLNIALIYLVFQFFDMILTPYTYILNTFTQIEYSPTLNTISYLSFKVLRSLLSIFILSPFCTEIGQITQAILAFLFYLILRLTKYKIIDNKLTVTKINKEKPPT